MAAISRILVADDLEREQKDEPAVMLVAASELAAMLGSEIHLVHAYDLPELAIPPPKSSLLEVPYVNAMQIALDKESDAVRERKPDLKLVSSVEKGDPVRVLLEDAKRDDCQMIVVGTHARQGFERVVLGSVAEEVIRRASVPVLSINPRVERPLQGPVKRILVALDPNDEHEVVARALELARAGSCEVVLLHVLEQWAYPVVQSASLLMGGFDFPLERELAELAGLRRTQLEKVSKKFRALGLRCEVVVVERASSVAGEIIERASRMGCDLIVMGRRKLGRVETALLGSVSRYVVREANCPVLTVGR